MSLQKAFRSEHKTQGSKSARADSFPTYFYFRRKTMKSFTDSSAWKMFAAIFGGFLFALGYRTVLVPLHLFSGGFTGISQLILDLLTRLFHFQLPAGIDVTGILLWFLNIPLFILAWKMVSRTFLIRTVATVLFQSLFMAVIPAPRQPLIDNVLTCAILGGVISGLGVGITLMHGGCGGGMDVLGIYCAKKFHGFSVGKLSLLINSAIYLYSAASGSPEIAVYSIIYSYTASIMMDRIHIQNIMSCAMIVTKKDAFQEQIIHNLNRGCTVWEGTGGYRKEQTHIIMTAVSKYETRILDHMIRTVDPDAFITYTNNVDISGNFEKRFDA